MDGAAAPYRPELRIKTPRVDEEDGQEIRRPAQKICTRARCAEGLVVGMMSGSGLFLLGAFTGQLAAMQAGMIIFMGACLTSSVLPRQD